MKKHLKNDPEKIGRIALQVAADLGIDEITENLRLFAPKFQPTLFDSMNDPYDNFLQEIRDYYWRLRNHGLAHKMAEAWAVTYGAIVFEGYPPVDLVSGYRSPQRQRDLLARWERGDRQGLTSKPASRSWHTVGLAIDIQTASPSFEVAREILTRFFKCRWGGDFTVPSPGHFDLPSGTKPPDVRLMG